jgi:2-polyprenyl-6-methoxyphenol hydroxylase-like FAD-dependent oxidoreductase
MPTHVLIAGASIAGPALARWLHRYGFTVTVVERAPQLRPGGQAVDLRGVAKEAVARMGLLDEVRAACTDTAGMSLVNRDNKPLARLRADQFGGDGLIAEIEILRGDLSEVFYAATKDDVEYLFGDHIEALDQHSDGVTVRFAKGSTRQFDLVVGADGLHSGLRTLVFGPESDFVRDLDLFLAFFSVPNRLGLESWALQYAEPGRSAGLRSVRDNAMAVAYFGFSAPRNNYDYRDTQAHKALLREHCAGMGWEVPWLLDQVDGAHDFYFDICSQIEMPRWSQGRVVLLGDAAFCPSPLSGQGTSLAVIGAYLLAGELAAAGGDHTAAFAAYERQLRDLVLATQKMGRDSARRLGGRDRFVAVRTAALLRLAPHPPLKWLITRLMNKVINGIELPDYTHLPTGSG